MHMKKFLLALSAFLAVGVMSVSCLTQGFEGPEHEIGVRPVSGLATKASSNGPINVNTFDQGRTIFLSAYFNDVNGTNHSQVYFTDIPFTYYSSKWAGGTSGTPNPKYWPHQGTMDFIALSKEGLSGTVTTTPSSQIVYVMPDNSSIQDDVMMAYAGGQNCAAHEAVPLAFKHAQAQVSVKAKLAAAAYSSNYGITIRSVVLRRAKYSGTVTGTASGTNNVTFSWSNVGSPNAGVGFGNASLALSTTEQSYGKGILVPAQSPTGVDGNIDIIIEYTLKNGLPATGSTPEERDLSYVYTVPATNWTAGNKYIYVFSFSWNEITCEPTVSDWGDGGTTNEPDPANGHDYVEIGGIKWATMNVGASSVTDYGLYFQWGDTQGYTSGQVGSGEGKKYFGWADYKYGNGSSSPDAASMTKYNSTDGKTVLDISDDAVNAAWGGNWRMPTTAEFAALGAAVNTAWTSNYQDSGVAGLVCTDKTDSSKVLFFPAAGYCFNGSVWNIGSYGYCWSGSVYSSYVQSAYSLSFYSGNVGWRNVDNRFLGFPVRGVLDYNSIGNPGREE